MPSSLKLDWCSYDAARTACERWHYSGGPPTGKTVKIGVWENTIFKGTVIFGLGSNQNLGTAFGLTMFQCCELCRVALDRHETPVSRIVSIAIRMLRKQSPGVRLIVSYADCDQDHHGGIYAAGNWIYVGKVQDGGGTPKFRVLGQVMHGRSVHARWGKGAQTIEWLRAHVDPRAQKVYTRGKHKYLMALDEEMKRQIEPLRKPYPKRAGSADAARPPIQAGGGGAIPTPALFLGSMLGPTPGRNSLCSWPTTMPR